MTSRLKDQRDSFAIDRVYGDVELLRCYLKGRACSDDAVR